MSYWGYPRCDPNGKEPLLGDSIPDVVVQFSWQYRMWYEEKALDDKMNLGLENEKGYFRQIIQELAISSRFEKVNIVWGNQGDENAVHGGACSWNDVG